MLAGLPYFDDPMNESLELTRNSIRLEVLPQLARFNPQLVANLARMAEAVSSESAYLDREAAAVGVIHDQAAARVAVAAGSFVDGAIGAHHGREKLLGFSGPRIAAADADFLSGRRGRYVKPRSARELDHRVGLGIVHPTRAAIEQSIRMSRYR